MLHCKAGKATRDRNVVPKWNLSRPSITIPCLFLIDPQANLKMRVIITNVGEYQGVYYSYISIDPFFSMSFIFPDLQTMKIKKEKKWPIFPVIVNDNPIFGDHPKDYKDTCYTWGQINALMQCNLLDSNHASPI